jgi:hypothetical protein
MSDAANAPRTWTTEQLKEEFDVIQFQAPYVIVRRKSDQRLGTLLFQHEPRVYYHFVEASYDPHTP